jgi:hypothetical protein
MFSCIAFLLAYQIAHIVTTTRMRSPWGTNLIKVATHALASSSCISLKCSTISSYSSAHTHHATQAKHDARSPEHRTEHSCCSLPCSDDEGHLLMAKSIETGTKGKLLSLKEPEPATKRTTPSLPLSYLTFRHSPSKHIL